ncbi:MAG: adenylyl-sulfate kinase [Promethearchaeota archaeon]|nr:MAG: adenylyl-sulfate kinase [Candidatus Lokiarchaeota archaeon]
MINQNFLICLAGLPASGKSTFAISLKKGLEKKYTNLEVKIIDPDIIRQKVTPDKFDYEKEYIVRKENLKMIKNELENGNIVISDDLNYYSSMRHDLKNIANILNLNFFIIHIATPIEFCLNWNKLRDEPIPSELINKIQIKFDKFNRYSWDKPIAKYDLSDVSDLNYLVSDFLDALERKMFFLKKKTQPKKKQTIYNIYNQNLDKITRSIVGKLIVDPNYLHLKNKIIKLRRNYVKKKKNKRQSEAEISKKFKRYIEKTLNIKIS